MQAVNLLHCGSTTHNAQNNRQKLGRRRNPNYSSSTSKSPSAPSAEKHSIGRGEYITYSASPIFKQGFIYMHGVRQGRARVYFAEKLLFNACVKFCYFSLEKKRYEKNIYILLYIFGPGGDTSIPPILMLNSTLLYKPRP